MDLDRCRFRHSRGQRWERKPHRVIYIPKVPRARGPGFRVEVVLEAIVVEFDDLPGRYDDFGPDDWRRIGIAIRCARANANEDAMDTLGVVDKPNTLKGIVSVCDWTCVELKGKESADQPARDMYPRSGVAVDEKGGKSDDFGDKMRGGGNDVNGAP